MNPIILNIDTAQEEAIISLSEGDAILGDFVSREQRTHASVLHPAIKDMLITAGLKPSDLNAIAVISGPGSYTGLRVGIGAAKGLAYALNIPVITIGTLELMAMNGIIAEGYKDFIYCPMIDARRMEIYTAIYNKELNEIRAPHALIINENTFEEELIKGELLFFGSGSLKFASVQKNRNAVLKEYLMSSKTMAIMAFHKFNNAQFTTALETKPLYIKDFFTISSLLKSG